MFSDIIDSIQNFITGALWVVVPFVLLLIFLDIWLFYRRARYINNFKWVTLELRVPREVIKSPKAMEQVFAVAYNTYSGGITFWEKWWKGKVEDWTSFELVGRAHSIHFFIRIQEGFRNLIESAIYAQYPDAEISEVPDYTNDFSPSLPDKTYDLWGSDFILKKENGYPILTYPAFEERGVIEEERRIDSIAVIVEAMSNLKESEAVWLQILIRPTGDGWKKKAEVLIGELQGKKSSSAIKIPGVSLLHGLGEFFENLVAAPVEYPTWSDPSKGAEEKKPETVRGQQKIIEAIENKISKLGFESIVRFLYIGNREAFSRGNITAVLGSFRQFAAMNLNSFKPNMKTITLSKGFFLFRKFELRKRKRLLYDNYRIRNFPKKFSILNPEELATFYHPPLTGVRATHLRRTEFKRGGPPPDLPIAL